MEFIEIDRQRKAPGMALNGGASTGANFASPKSITF